MQGKVIVCIELLIKRGVGDVMPTPRFIKTAGSAVAFAPVRLVSWLWVDHEKLVLLIAHKTDHSRLVFRSAVSTIIDGERMPFSKHFRIPGWISNSTPSTGVMTVAKGDSRSEPVNLCSEQKRNQSTTLSGRPSCVRLLSTENSRESCSGKNAQ